MDEEWAMLASRVRVIHLEEVTITKGMKWGLCLEWVRKIGILNDKDQYYCTPGGRNHALGKLVPFPWKSSKPTTSCKFRIREPWVPGM